MHWHRKRLERKQLGRILIACHKMHSKLWKFGIMSLLILTSTFSLILTNEAHSQAEIARNINNSDSNLIQDAERTYFTGILPSPAKNWCEGLGKHSQSQGADITHLFNAKDLGTCKLDFIFINEMGSLLAKSDQTGVITLGKFTSPPRVADYHPGTGRLAVFSGEDLLVLEAGVIPRKLSTLKANPYDLEFSPEGDSLLIGAADSRLYRWKFLDYEIADSNQKKDLTFERYIGHSTVVSSVAFHPFGRVIFSGDWKGGVNIWELYDVDNFGGEYDRNNFWGRGFIEAGKRRTLIRADTDSVEQIELSANGEFAFLAIKSGKIEGVQVRGMKKAGQFQAHKGFIYDIAVDKTGENIVTVGRDGLVKLIGYTKKKSSFDVKYAFKETASVKHNWIRQVEVNEKGVFSVAGLKGKIKTLTFDKEEI
ncbi:MAG: hypothetical protein R3A13_11610 [Bdellovibrionota bacterium]